MKYGLNDKPSLFPMLLYGLQWFVISVPSIIILGAITAEMNNSDMSAQILYMQKLFALIGFGLIVQVLWGHRLPLVIGPASVLLVGIIAATSERADAVNTSILLGGCFLFILGASGLFNKIQRIFTPRIVSVILALIAFTLAPVILHLIFGSKGPILFNFLLAFSLSLFMIYMNNRLQGVWRSTSCTFGTYTRNVYLFSVY
jgi:xanthine/uracil permease